MIRSSHFKEDLEAERILAQLENRVFDKRAFWAKHSPYQERATENVEDFESWSETKVHTRVKPRPIPTTRDLKLNMRGLLTELIKQGLGVRRIAEELTTRKIPKVGRDKNSPWTAPGVQWLLLAHGLTTDGNRKEAANVSWTKRKLANLPPKTCKGCRKTYEAKSGKAARRNFKNSRYCSQDCARRYANHHPSPSTSTTA